MIDLEFEIRSVRDKGVRTHLVTRVSAALGEVVLDKPGNERLIVKAKEIQAQRVLDAFNRVRVNRAFGLEFNCVSFAHDIAGIPLETDMQDGLPNGWDFERAMPISALRNFGTDTFSYRQFLPETTQMGLGHWHTMIDSAQGLVLHVNGGGQPVTIASVVALLDLYPQAEFTHHIARPQ